MTRKVTGSSKTLYRILWCAAAPARTEWLFNNLRIRHALHASRLSLLASGSTSNEALHHELNGWFKQTQRIHQATLALKLHAMLHMKQRVHSTALYSPASKQIPSGFVLIRMLGRELWSGILWTRWCSALGNSKAELRLVKDRRAQVERLADWVRKRPSAPPSVHKVIKRTPFKLIHRDGLVRAGVRNTIFKPMYRMTGKQSRK